MVYRSSVPSLHNSFAIHFTDCIIWPKTILNPIFTMIIIFYNFPSGHFLICCCKLQNLNFIAMTTWRKGKINKTDSIFNYTTTYETWEVFNIKCQYYKMYRCSVVVNHSLLTGYIVCLIINTVLHLWGPVKSLILYTFILKRYTYIVFIVIL